MPEKEPQYFKEFRQEMFGKFEKVDSEFKKIDGKFEAINKDLSEIKDKLDVHFEEIGNIKTDTTHIKILLANKASKIDIEKLNKAVFG